MRPLRLFLFFCSCFFLFVCLVYISLSNEADRYLDPDHPSEDHGYNGSPFLRNPASLFTPSATISLTDDNSTYFAARPAAFGPNLPNRGLIGQLWIGAGFSDSSIHAGEVAAFVEGELGCSDIPGWNDRDLRVHAARSSAHDVSKSGLSSLTRPWAYMTSLMMSTTRDEDNIEHTDESLDTSNMRRGSIDEDPTTSRTADIRLLQEAAEINGKVALLSRGGCGFAEKVMWAQRRGAVAVIVGDNLRGGPLVRMSAHGDTSNVSIPSLFTSHTSAHLLSSLVPSGRNAGVIRRTRGRVQNDESKQRADYLLPWPVSDDDNDDDLDEGLWVTLSPTDMSASPFFNTLFVLVISPLFTLAIVYSMLLLRSRIRRRRWRAPKSVVERLPVHIYHAISRSTSATASPQPPSPDAATPLLSPRRPTDIQRSPDVNDATQLSGSAPASSQYGSLESNQPNEQEKIDAGLAEWRRKYKGRQSECVVCLEEYVDGVSKVMSLPCGHEFHADCITPWLVTRRRTCPICKGDVVRQMGSITRSSSEANDMTEEEVQTQAAETTNDSPASALPLSSSPAPAATNLQEDDYDNDVERGQVGVAATSPLQRTLSSTQTQPRSWFSRRLQTGLEYLGLRNERRPLRRRMSERED